MEHNKQYLINKAAKLAQEYKKSGHFILTKASWRKRYINILEDVYYSDITYHDFSRKTSRASKKIGGT